jgi:cysteine-rich repeat protein
MLRESKCAALATIAVGSATFFTLATLAPFAGCSSSSSTNGSDGGPDSSLEPTPICGDMIVQPGEECDQGPKNGTGMGCEKNCRWTCIAGTLNGDAICNDHDPCNGTETCEGADAGVPHTCSHGTPLADGTSCGMGVVCRMQKCSSSVCGDGIIEPPEECDLGSQNGPGTGCESDCTFSCVSTDASRNCSQGGPCVLAGVCDDTKHTCSGASRPDGTPCGTTGQVCKAGSCVAPNCGDGVVEPPEQCDFGAGNGIGTGCEANCTFSCSLSPNSCITPDSCAGTNTCSAVTVGGSTGQKCVVGMPLANGATCPNGGTCQSQLCVTPNCGNGKVDPGEECDWGSAGNVHGSGCEPDCTFTCSPSALSPNVCPGIDPCSANPQVCQPNTGPMGNGGRKCSAGTVLAACMPCGGTSICVNRVCKPSTCGDGCVVPPETCEPPNTTTCDSTCHKVVCGDGMLEGQEQCDDGNTINLDGCDSTCLFEQEQRATQLQYFGSTDSFCIANALGSQVITATGIGQLQMSIDADVTNGVNNLIFKFMPANGQPTDLSGTSGPAVLGSFSATVQYGDAGAYSGNSDLDWWYQPDPTMIDTSRNPLSMLTGSFASKTLTTLPGPLRLKMDLGGSAATLDFWKAKLQIAIGASSAPAASTGLPPGHLPSEHIKPGLTSFATAGVGVSGPAGELCGNITADSLGKVLTPPLIAMGGPGPCAEVYSGTTNHLLDVLVNGCTVFGMILINATQPDQQDPTVTFPSGTTPPYKLSASGGAHVIDTCKDSSASPKTVPIATCRTGLAYSSAFLFQTDRVVVK